MAATFKSRLNGLLRSPSGAAGAAAAATFVLIAVAGPVIFGEAAARVDLDQALRGSTAAHALGTDELGRDLVARVVVATRMSLGLSVAATLLGAAVGVLIGALPSIAPSWVGRAVANLINLALAFPALLLTLFVAAIVGPGVRSATLAIALALAPIFARLAYTLSAGIRNADYVSAARLLGVRPLAILTRHVLPNIAGPLLVTGVMGVSGALIVLSGLSFLGLGVQAPMYDWGVLLSQGLNRIYVDPAPALAPAAAIVLAGLGLSLFGETLAILLGLREVRASAPPRRPAEMIPTARAPLSADGCDELLLVEELRVDARDARGAPVPIVRGASFSLRPGERLGLVGESGSGKTMAALAIARLLDGRLQTRAASLRFDGRALMGPDAIDVREARALLGGSLPVVFQDPLGSFNPLLRVGGQLAEVAVAHGGLSRRAAMNRTVERLTAVGLDAAPKRARQYPHELSGGMLQRSMIAMSLMLRPRLLIADEPTTALDVTVQKQVLQLLQRVCAETEAGLLLISHDLAVVAETCDRILVMYAGRIVEDLPADRLSSGPAHPYTRALLASTLNLDTDRGTALATLPGRAPAPGDVTGGCAFAPRCPRAEPRCADQDPDLRATAADHRVACWRPYVPTRSAA